MAVSVAQSCPTLCNRLQPAGLLCPWDSPSENTGVHAKGARGSVTCMAFKELDMTQVALL